MNAAFAWVSDFVALFISVFPHLIIVKKIEGGVKFVRGKHVKILKPGLRWYWPLVTEQEVVPVVRQVTNLSTQTLMTKDGKTVIASAVIVYRVSDIEAFLVENHDADEAIGEVAIAALRDAIADEDLEDLRKNFRNKIDTRLTKEVMGSLKPFGVEVESVRLTSFAPATTFSIIGSTPTVLLMPAGEE
jgi:regulator of protease activity HflC (stomatin/prohibitin superfamily)